MAQLFGDVLFSLTILGADKLFTTLSAALLPRASAPDTANFSTPAVTALLATSLENFEVAIDVSFLPVDLKMPKSLRHQLDFVGQHIYSIILLRLIHSLSTGFITTVKLTGTSLKSMGLFIESVIYILT